MNAPLRGIVVPLITPLTLAGNLDLKSLARLVEHTLGGGVTGLFVLGTTGEGPSLGRNLRAEVVRETCRLVHGRVPVLVAVTDTAISDSLELAQVASQAGADAIVSAGPAYFPLSQCDLLRYVESLAQASPLPLFLYNMPSHTHIWFEPETVARAARLSNVVGMKDSSGELSYLLELATLLEQHPRFSLLIGPEELTAQAVRSGIHGGVNGGANLFPALYARLHAAAARQCEEEADRLQRAVMEISSTVYCKDNYLQGMKCAAAFLGLCENVLAPPLVAWDAKRSDEMRDRLTALQAMVHATLAVPATTSRPAT